MNHLLGFHKKEVGFQTADHCTALVTGSSGVCGARLVELLLERGAKTVCCFDVAEPRGVLATRFQQLQQKCSGKLVVYSGEKGDLTNDAAVEAPFQQHKIDVVFHVAALVGPFYDRDKYYDVNTQGTIRIIDNCKKYKVPKLVYSSSPSTRFTGKDVRGEREDQLPMPDKWLAMYAETKAYGEMEVTKACCDDLMTVSVAPHQIYGPHDSLFLPNLLETAGNGRLRIFGKGRNQISVCYVDNYAHGLLCGADALYKDSPALGKFYIITDGEPQYFWEMLNSAVVAMGFTDLHSKWHLPVWLLYGVAYVANVIGCLLGKKFKLNPFNVKMLIIDRYFSLENAKKDLKFEPVLTFDKAWPLTVEWFREHWLPEFQKNKQ